MLKSIILLAYLFAVHGAPSLPIYKDAQPQTRIQATIQTSPEQQPQEEYYSQQYVPVGIPREVTQYDDANSKFESISPAKNARRAITSSAETNKSPHSPSSDDDLPKEDLFIINPAPSTQFVLPPKDSVVPKVAGSYVKSEDDKGDTFNGPITNPAAYYLDGSDLENVKAPNCRMTGCNGPVPNDYDFFLESGKNANENEACHQTFVLLNSCVDKRGYPVGMICTICCDCAADFVSEMKKSRGYLQGYKTK